MTQIEEILMGRHNALFAHQSHAGKSRMKNLNKQQRRELARKAGLASAEKRRLNADKNIRNAQAVPA